MEGNFLQRKSASILEGEIFNSFTPAGSDRYRWRRGKEPTELGHLLKRLGAVARYVLRAELSFSGRLCGGVFIRAVVERQEDVGGGRRGGTPALALEQTRPSFLSVADHEWH